METLSEILSGAAAPGKSETVSTPEAKSEPAKDVKPAESAKADPAASAPSAEQAKPDDKGEAKPDEKPAEKPSESEPQPRDEKGKFAEKPDEVASLRSAVQAERKKRQEAERKAKEADEALKAAKPKEETPKKDFWEDPEAALAERDQRLQSQLDSRLFKLSERYAMKAHTDYQEVMAELDEVCAAEKERDGASATAASAIAQMQSNPDEPAEALYQFAVNRREMKAIGGDLGKYKESIAEPFKATIAEKEKALADKDRQLSEQAKQIKSLQDQLDKLGKVPASLNTEPSSSRASVEIEATDAPSLDKIVEPRKRRA